MLTESQQLRGSSLAHSAMDRTNAICKRMLMGKLKTLNRSANISPRVQNAGVCTCFGLKAVQYIVTYTGSFIRT